MKSLGLLHDKMNKSIDEMTTELEKQYPLNSEVLFTIRYKQKSLSCGVVIGYWREYLRVRMYSTKNKVVDVFFKNLAK